MTTTIPTTELEERFEKAKLKFKNFLENNNNRKTPERFAILEEIYINQHHFDAEELYIKMKQNAYRVSRATIYNTLEILVECDLIKRHQFGDNKTLYERSYGFEDHDHFICMTCGEISEFDDNRVYATVSDHSAQLGFMAERHSLNVYGRCSNCKKNTHS